MHEDEILGNEMTQYYLANILKLKESMISIIFACYLANNSEMNKERYVEIQQEIDNIAKHMTGKINQNALYVNFLLGKLL
jgi:hypothetical protein